MRSIESGVCGPKLLSSPDLSNGESSDAILYCPECAARLRLIGGNLPQAEQGIPIAKANRVTLPDWLPSSGTSANPLPVAPTSESFESTAADASGFEGPVGSTFDVTVELEANDEQDEPTRILHSSELLQSAAEVDDGSVGGSVESSLTVAVAPAADILLPPGAERAAGEHDGSEDCVTPLVPGHASAPDSGSRQVFSDAPVTRELTQARQSEVRSRSPLRHVGIASGVALLGVVAFVLYRAQPQRNTDGRVASVAAANRPTAIETAPAQVLSSAASPAAPAAPAAELGATLPDSSEPPPVVVTKTGTKPSKLSAVPKPSQVPSVVESRQDEVSAQQDEVSAQQDEAKPAVVAFDAEAAASALDGAATRAGSCRQASDPSGVAVVTVTFAPSGRVTTANIAGPPFVGTETGSCIAATMRSAKIPEYSGPFKTVKKTVTIR